jgi:2'-5' RNA ligase
MAGGGDLGAPLPFVLTLEIDGESFARLNELRRSHFPPERNLVPAHVTLFQRLPGGHAREIKTHLSERAPSQRRFAVAAGEVKELERGVALFLHAPQLGALREVLAAEWWPWLTDQDRLGFRPHVTLANNVSSGEARRIRESLGDTLRSLRIQAIGLHLWRYRDGPWDDERLFRFM